MATKQRSVKTSLATITLEEPGLVVQRFRAGVRIDTAGLAEMMEARDRMGIKGPYALLTTIPANADLDLRTTQVDHFAQVKDRRAITAVAVVTGDSMMEMVSKLYFTYFPQVFRMAVFNDEEKAREWLRQGVSRKVAG